VKDTSEPPERAYLVGLDQPRARFDAADSLEELATLVQAAAGEIAGRVIQQRRTPDPNTWVGKGKLAEISAECTRLAADLVVCDDELSPRQQRGLEDGTGQRVIDRSAVILDIFARHAQSKEGRLQVELAQYEYRLPRLSGRGKQMSRLGAGIGTRGPGETKLESERQLIRDRIHELKEKIAEVAKQRGRARGSRAKEGLFLAALVGYTNVGKSTLLNALAGASVHVADQPFATLDPTTRRMALPGGGALLVSDTVGFISKLPPALIAAFRATLEELDDADVLVHVVDVGHPNLHERMIVVRETLTSLGLASREILIVFNKSDTLRGGEGDAMREALGAEFPAAVFVSARTGEGVDTLRNRLGAIAASRWTKVDVTVPHREGGLLQRVRERGKLRNAEYGEAGIHIQAEVPADLAAELTASARATARP
jgi:GTP-binding protein HflX